MNKKKRPDQDSEIEALSKGLKVLEALEGNNFEPVKVRKIIDRTDLSRNIVDRALITLKINGYAVQDASGKWSIGRRLIRFAQTVSKHEE